MIKTIILLSLALPIMPQRCDSPTVISDFCQSYTIIRPSRSDTPDTLKQIATANAKYRAVCSAVVK